jgi:hypothetical protein
MEAKEFFAYMEDDFLISPKFKINAGIHASGFLVEGKFYRSFQPRFSARYLMTPDLSLKASYARMAQYIHLLTNAGVGFPTDLWVPATAKVTPEQSSLISLGAAFNMNDKYEFSVETYYKKMSGLIEYKDGASYLDVEDNWQNKVENGEGASYGSEFFLHKKTGKINGWIGYTLAWTNRTFANLNDGKTFPYRYDRRHDVKIVGIYQWRENRDFSVTWIYGTGNAVTLPQSAFLQTFVDEYPSYHRGQQEKNPTLKYHGERNSFRMRAYHRIDVSYTTTKKTKWGERSWSFSIYNGYNRRNPFFIDLKYVGHRTRRFVQYSLFPIIPSVAYRFKF